MKKITCQYPLIFIVSISSICIMLTNFSYAKPVQRVELPSSPNPVGSGARALGMGGAFIAVADDATAASWNPGGLIQLEKPEISIVGAYFHRTEENHFGTNPEADGSSTVSKCNINYFSAAWPFEYFGLNMIVSFNYQNLLDFTREASFPLELQTNTTTIHQMHDYEMEGSLSAFVIAYCLQITPKFSVGLTLNLWEDGLYNNEWKQKAFQRGTGTFVINDESYDFSFEAISHSEYSFSGINTNLGILWQLNARLTLGMVLKTPFKADLKHEYTSNEFYVYPTQPQLDDSYQTQYNYNEKLDMPMSYGIGLAYRFSDKLTTSVDLYRTLWDDFMLTDENGDKTSPITLKTIDESDVEPTLQVRTGMEYLFIGQKHVVPLRFGLFYDPAPADGHPDDYYGFSLGSGITFGPVIFDIAYQYRFGNDVSQYMLKALDFSQNLQEHTIYTSIIIHL